MTTEPIFDVPLRIPTDGFTFVDTPLADGVRASELGRCPSCAIIRYLTPNDERVQDFVNDGVAFMGHMASQVWAHNAFHGRASYTVETPIPWKHGVSHDDVTVYDGEWAGLYEVKTHSKKSPTAPSSANYAQAEFRLRLCELAKRDVPGPMRLVMIGKAGHEGGWVRGPWTVDLTDERRSEIDQVLARVDGIMERADTLDTTQDAELRALGCSQCFPPVRVWREDVSNLVDIQFHDIVKVPRLRHEWSSVEADLKEIRGKVLRALRSADQTHAETWLYNLTVTGAGTKRETVRIEAKDALSSEEKAS